MISKVKDLLQKEEIDCYFKQPLLPEEDIIKIPSKKNTYDWIVFVSPKDVAKSLLTSGASVSLGGEEDVLSSNMMRLKSPDAKVRRSFKL